MIKGQGLAQTGNAVIAVATVLLAVAPFFADVGTLRLAIEILVTFAVALSFNLLGGYAGLLSFGQNVFVGLGAYCLFLAANWTAASPFVSSCSAPCCAGFLRSLSRRCCFGCGMHIFQSACGS